MQSVVRRDSFQLKRHATRQRQPSLSEIYANDKPRHEDPRKFVDERSGDVHGTNRQASDSGTSDSDASQEAVYEDIVPMAYSDNDVFQRRAKRFRERRFLDEWDNRSVKSVAF